MMRLKVFKICFIVVQEGLRRDSNREDNSRKVRIVKMVVSDTFIGSSVYEQIYNQLRVFL